LNLLVSQKLSQPLCRPIDHLLRVVLICGIILATNLSATRGPPHDSRLELIP
jgi:hypothetical protein